MSGGVIRGRRLRRGVRSLGLRGTDAEQALPDMADLDEVPASAAAGGDNKEWLRHFPSLEEYQKWLERVGKQGIKPVK